MNLDRPSSDLVALSPKALDPEDAFNTLLRQVRREVDARLAGYLDARVADAARHGSDVEAMVDAIRTLTLRGGKRLRAALVAVGYLSENDTLPQEIALDAGVAFELLQTYLLVHDDWMDGDTLRRGGPSVHAMLQRHYKSEHVGNSAAILAGDYAAALALDVLSKLDAQPERLVKALALFAEIQQDVIAGQQIDVVGREPDIEKFYRLKTGSYTVRGPLLLGATLARVAPEVMAALEGYALPLGVAFQLQDDLLGVFGRREVTGKPVGEDIRRGANTSVAAFAHDMLQDQDLKSFDAVFGNTEASDEQLKSVIELLENRGVQSAIVERIHQLMHEALEALVDAPISSSSRAWLLGFSSVIGSRID